MSEREREELMHAAVEESRVAVVRCLFLGMPAVGIIELKNGIRMGNG